jgi:hypothetical protein
MSTRVIAWLWLGLGALGLALLWTAVLFRPAWMPWAGAVFTATPFAAALAECLWSARRDPGSAVAAVGLVVLLCIAWLL